MSRRLNVAAPSPMSTSTAKITKAINLIEPLRSKTASEPPTPSNPTKRHAMKLLEREEQNAKKSRLESLLTHQYIGKFGTKAPQSAINSYITARIHQFVSSYDNIHDTEADLPSLEEEIAQRTHELKHEIRQAKESSRSSAQASRSTSFKEGNPDSNQANTMNMGMKTLRDLAHSDNPKVNSQWPIINALLKIDEEEQKQQEVRQKLMKQEKFKQILDEQLSYQEKEKQRKELERLELRRLADIEAENAKNDKILTKQKLDDSLRKEREIRLIQIEENKFLKEKEKQMKIYAEKLEMERAKQLAKEEEDYKQQLKLKQKHQQDLLLLENEKNKELKQKQLLERQAYEKKLNDEYERKLEEEERARQNAFKTRMSKLENLSRGYADGVGQQLEQKKQQEERNTYEALIQKEKQDMERERNKIENRRQNELKNAEYNIRLMEEKRKQKEKERFDALETRQRIERELLESKLQEKAEKEKKKIQFIELKKNLDVQVQLSKQNKLKEKNYYNDSDSLLNPALMQKLESDPTLLNKVIERVSKQNQVLSSRVKTQIF